MRGSHQIECFDGFVTIIAMREAFAPRREAVDTYSRSLLTRAPRRSLRVLISQLVDVYGAPMRNVHLCGEVLPHPGWSRTSISKCWPTDVGGKARWTVHSERLITRELRGTAMSRSERTGSSARSAGVKVQLARIWRASAISESVGVPVCSRERTARSERAVGPFHPP